MAARDGLRLLRLLLLLLVVFRFCERFL